MTLSVVEEKNARTVLAFLRAVTVLTTLSAAGVKNAKTAPALLKAVTV